MNFTQEQLAKAKAAKSAEELLALAKESGMELTKEEAAKFYAELNKEGDLADVELDNVSGGCGGDPDPSYVTELKCANCGHRERWNGDFSEGKYECWNCHLNTLVAISVERR